MYAYTYVAQASTLDYKSKPLLARAAKMSLARSPSLIPMDVSSEMLRDSGPRGMSSLPCSSELSVNAEFDSGTVGG